MEKTFHRHSPHGCQNLGNLDQGFSPEVVLPPRGHWEVSGDICGCHYGGCFWHGVGGVRDAFPPPPVPRADAHSECQQCCRPGRVWSAWGWGSSFWGQKQLSGQQKDLLPPRLPAPGLKEEGLTQAISPSLNFSLPILSPFKNQIKAVTSCPL